MSGFRRKLFTLLARPKNVGGGGGGSSLDENDIDFVIELIDRQNEAAEGEDEDHEEPEKNGEAERTPRDTSNKGETRPCSELRDSLRHALKNGNFALAENISRSYTKCMSARRILRPKRA